MKKYVPGILSEEEENKIATALAGLYADELAREQEMSKEEREHWLAEIGLAYAAGFKRGLLMEM